MEKEINTDEISLLESYFCKPGEFFVDKLLSDNAYLLRLSSEGLEGSVVVETQFHLVCKDKLYYITSNPIHITFNQLKGNLTKKQLESFKQSVLTHKETLMCNEEFNLFEFITWLANELQNLIATSDISCEKKSIKDSVHIHGTLMKLDHIRSTNRYYKFFNDASNQTNVHLKLLRCAKLLYILVFGRDETVKEYVKLHKTSLVDVDSGGKPCKERMLQIKTEKIIENDVVEKFNLGESGFHLLKFEGFGQFEKELELFSFSRIDL